MGPSYIFFYGSCISSESRARTGLTGACLPCSVRGFERTWSASVSMAAENIQVNPDIAGVTAVSVQEREDVTANGVCVRVEASELPAFDIREAGYTRRRLSRDAIVVSDSIDSASLPSDAEYWIYVHPAGQPSPTHPVLQSYLDVMLAGCSEYGKAFAEEFCATTRGWGTVTGSFLDDRSHPGYVRASADATARAEQWDRMLAEHAPEALASRVPFVKRDDHDVTKQGAP
eukprot:1086673-Prymnesium_polylepis.2